MTEAPSIIKRPPPPPPPISSVVRGDTSHVQRVTLNLIRLSAACPPELRRVLDTLADDDHEWMVDRLPRSDIERVYAYVDGALANRAMAEFTADTNSLIDHRSCDAECRLCGQKHIRFEFLLRNGQGGRDVWTGSTCIEEYGLSVDGETTAEEALKLLRAAIGRAKRKAEREDWQAAHPDHVADFADISRAVSVVRTTPSYSFKTALPGNWWRTCKDFLRVGKAPLKFYSREEFLTELRTRQVYGSGDKPGVLVIARSLCAAWDAANAGAKVAGKTWRAYIDANKDVLNSSDLDYLQRWEVEGKGEDTLANWERDRWANIRMRVEAARAPKPPPAKDDTGDLPL
jgi:hypothetical protein